MNNTILFEEINEKNEISDFIKNKLVEYNYSKIGKYEKYSFNIYSQSLEGEIISGATGEIVSRICYVRYLWTNEKYRGKGFASKMIKELSKKIYEKKCKWIQVETLEFQAKKFYEKCGFVTIASMPSCFDNIEEYILRLKLLK